MTMPLDPSQQQLQNLLASNEAVLAQLNARLQATIPLFIEEFAGTGQIAVSSPGVLNVPPSRDTYFKCTGIYVSIPFGSISGNLQLGSQFNLPIQNTTTLLCPIQRILVSGDVRQLTFTTGASAGGSAFVWLWGEAVPKYGKL